jgi:hypothetical protein
MTDLQQHVLCLLSFGRLQLLHCTNQIVEMFIAITCMEMSSERYFSLAVSMSLSVSLSLSYLLLSSSLITGLCQRDLFRTLECLI